MMYLIANELRSKPMGNQFYDFKLVAFTAKAVTFTYNYIL